MNLDELQSVQARERQSSDLQHLRSSFYREVGEFIEELNEKRARIVEEAEDPFSDPEVRRLTDDIETAEGTVEAIYERRVGKVVKKASIAAAGMPIDDDGLTSEEEALFEDLVDRIESNRETVLSVLDGDSPSVSCSIDEEPASGKESEAPPDTGGPTADSESDLDTGSDPTPAPEDGLSAADLMGESGSTAETSAAGAEATETAPEDAPPVSEPTARPGEKDRNAGEKAEDPPAVVVDDGARSGADRASSPDTPEDGAEQGTVAPDTGTSPERTGAETPGLPRTTVRITADVGEIVGADDRDYDLGTEDVVTLPEPNADVLVEKDAAERVE